MNLQVLVALAQDQIDGRRVSLADEPRRKADSWNLERCSDVRRIPGGRGGLHC
jgi:hypothetical protein